MRVLLVGTQRQRDDLREHLDLTADIVGEFDSIGAARDSGIAADAMLLAPLRRRQFNEEAAVDALTARESEVLELVAEGLSNKAIARRLAISDQTVKFHIASIIAKLGAPHGLGPVRRAVRRGLITL
jgi:DNA-binding NarL/FixJ family response regulator